MFPIMLLYTTYSVTTTGGNSKHPHYDDLFAINIYKQIENCNFNLFFEADDAVLYLIFALAFLCVKSS